MTVEVHVVTPEREVWSGPTQMLVARGVDGELGILGGHAPMMVQLTIGPLRLQREDGSWQICVIDGGFLHVTSDGGSTRADVLASDAELAEDVDVGSWRRRLEELRAGQHDDGAAEAEIAKALARVNLAS